MAFVDVPILPLLTEIADAKALGAYGSTMAVADLCTSLGFVLGNPCQHPPPAPPRPAPPRRARGERCK